MTSLIKSGCYLGNVHLSPSIMHNEIINAIVKCILYFRIALTFYSEKYKGCRGEKRGEGII